MMQKTPDLLSDFMRHAIKKIAANEIKTAAGLSILPSIFPPFSQF